MAREKQPKKNNTRRGAAGGHATWLKYGPEHYRRITKGGQRRPTYDPGPDGDVPTKKGVPATEPDRELERERVRQLARFCSPTEEAPPLMACGHAAQATTYDGQPLCLLCLHHKRHDDALVPMTPVPDLTGRMAVCRQCEAEAASAPNLPLFEHLPLFPHDSFSCPTCTNPKERIQ